MILCKRRLTHSGRKKRLLHNTDTRAGTNPAGVVASGDAKPQPPSFSAGLFLAWTPCETLPDFVPPLCPLFRVSEISRYIPEARTISSVFCASFCAVAEYPFRASQMSQCFALFRTSENHVFSRSALCSRLNFSTFARASNN